MWQKEIIKECIRILGDNGSICWQVGNYVKDREIFPLDFFFYPILKEYRLQLRNRIIWKFGHGLHASTRFSGRYEVILWFTKSNNYIFNLDSVRIPQKYPGKLSYKGKNKGHPTSNPLGKNPSDIWEIISQNWEEGIWDIPNVKSNHPEKTIHPAQYPVELVERLVLALSNRHSFILDPFAGVGSALIAGLLNDRKVIGVDKEKIYTDIAYKRIISLFDGTIKRRPIDRSVWVPKGTEKVLKPPEGWTKEKV
jgi:adenine-specific DNA-methyltransferase